HTPCGRGAARLQSLPAALRGRGRRRGAAARRADRREPVRRVRPIDRPGRRRRTILRRARPDPCGAPEALMTSADPPPLTPRPAATVMLVRDGKTGLGIFLIRRPSAMEFVPGACVVSRG